MIESPIEVEVVNGDKALGSLNQFMSATTTNVAANVAAATATVVVLDVNQT